MRQGGVSSSHTPCWPTLPSRSQRDTETQSYRGRPLPLHPGEAAAAPAEDEAAEEEAAEDDAPPPFSKPGFDFLAYDAAKLVKKAPIAHWLPDREEWQVGRVSALLKKKWAEYPNLPKVKGKFIEYSHAFNEADYNKLWLFVKEREFTAQEADIFMA